MTTTNYFALIPGGDEADLGNIFAPGNSYPSIITGCKLANGDDISTNPEPINPAPPVTRRFIFYPLFLFSIGVHSNS